MMEAYLQTLVSFYPESAQQEHVGALLAYVRKQLVRHNLKTQALSYNGVHSLYAHPTGKKHSKLLLQAHVDVVPGHEQVFSQTDTMYKGRGVYDMLFAAACYLHLLDELGDDVHKLDLGIMLSGDEELGGFNSVESFLADGYTADVCLLPDAGNGFGTLSIGAKGIYGCTVRIRGTAHHGSRPWEGDGAAIKLVHFLHDLDAAFGTASEQSSYTVTVAKLAAGDADNRGPGYADASLDVRYLRATDLLTVKETLTDLLSRYDGEILSVTEGSNFELDHQHPHIKRFTDLYEKHHGSELSFMTAHGSSDARFFTEKQIPVIMMRPDGGGAHGDNEWISKQSTAAFYELLKEYVLEVATIGGDDE